MFSQSVIEKIQSYVYFLVDPRSNEVFYVGKGKGNRVFAHANNAKIFEGDAASQKIALIKEIHASGNEVETFILRHGISSEASAYITEAALIDLLYLLDPKADNQLFQVTNPGRNGADAAPHAFEAGLDEAAGVRFSDRHGIAVDPLSQTSALSSGYVGVERLD